MADNFPVIAEGSLTVLEQAPVGLDLLKRQVQAIQGMMASVMVEGTHFGVIPGTDKPSLLKAGADKIGLMFRLLPYFKVKRQDFADAHREYEVVCTLKDPRGVHAGQGLGFCSTREAKYRYRSEKVATTIAVPKDYWKHRDDKLLLESLPEELRGKGKVSAVKDKDTNRWYIAIGSGRAENPDIADTYNTVLKMAKKRAHVDAIITATAASDIFTQDMEDFVEAPVVENVEKPQEKKGIDEESRIAGLEAFSEFLISKARLEEHLGHSYDDVTQEEFAELRRIWEAIKKGGKAEQLLKTGRNSKAKTRELNDLIKNGTSKEQIGDGYPSGETSEV